MSLLPDRPDGTRSRTRGDDSSTLEQKFPPELLYRVRDGIEKSGFCVFDVEDMERLFAEVSPGYAARRQALVEFAALCGVRMQTTPDLNSARFVSPLSPEALHSPVFPDVEMRRSEIEPGLFAFNCPKSAGVWIPLVSFLDWKAHHEHDEPPSDTYYAFLPEDDSHQRALICPETGHLLIRYRVGHGLKFHIDLSPETGSIWLDRGEWQALKSKGLHLELNHIFTSSYQRRVRLEEHEEALDKSFRERIGAADFARVAEFKSWLAAHPRRRHIRAFLFDHVPADDE